MSDSDDSDTAAVRRNRSRETALFRDASSSPPPNPQKTKRPAPRFLGDNTPDPTSPSAAEDLFADLDDLPNDLDVALPKRIDVDAFEKLLGANVDKVDNEFNVDETGEQVDEVKKKKRVVAKMDDVRLLGENGFPKLIETIAKFRPGAKGNEVKDLKRLLSIYQLWAHQMYPKTNLRDTLVAVEKLCHKRSVHNALKEYRHDLKNGGREARRAKALGLFEPQVEGESAGQSQDPDLDELPAVSAKAGPPAQAPSTATMLKTSSQNVDDLFNDLDDESFDNFDADEEAMMAELEMEIMASSRRPPQTQTQESKSDSRPGTDFDEDAEAEAMLAELEMEAATSGGKKTGTQAVVNRRREPSVDAFDEDEEAMLAELEMEASTSKTVAAPPTKVVLEDGDKELDAVDDGFDAEAEALLVEMEKSGPCLPSPVSPAPDTNSNRSPRKDIDFDALMDETGEEGNLTAEEESLLSGTKQKLIDAVQTNMVTSIGGRTVDDAELLAAEDVMLAELEA